MPKINQKSPSEYIAPLRMNRLRGRMLRVPASNVKKRREILMVYGHHSSLERMFGFVEDLSRYGNITMPDLPGFGGMESFYKIRREPTIDAYADYLASFVKLRYKRRRLTIIGASFGFVVVTRMLQKYPDLAARVDLLVSVVGFTHKNDFTFGGGTTALLKSSSVVFSRKSSAFVVKTVILRKPFIKAAYKLAAGKHSKLKDADNAELVKRIDFEATLWQNNDFRTHMKTLGEMLRLDLCSKQVPLTVQHVCVSADRYLDEHTVEQHMRVIYKDFNKIVAQVPAHAPTVVAGKKEAAVFIPRKIRTLLNAKA